MAEESNRKGVQMLDQRNYSHILCASIARLRRERGLTQEALADRLGVTFQAVSKWENEQSCPDVVLLPALAEALGVRIDSLFGQLDGVALPWQDDGALRAVLFQGTTLLAQGAPEAKRFTFCYEGDACSVYSHLSIECGYVEGNATAQAGHIHCGDVGGNVSSNSGEITCGCVGGNISSLSGDIQCEDVDGDVTSNSGNIVCDCVDGNVRSGSGCITCDSVDGDAYSESGDITCNIVEGDVRAAQGQVHCDEIHGDVQYAREP